MTQIEFTQKEKYIIAEFIFAKECDTLCKFEVIALLPVMETHSMITNINLWRKNVNGNVKGTVETLVHLLDKHVDKDQSDSIMKEYTSSKLG